MVDRKQESLIIKQTGWHIAIVTGPDAENVNATSEVLVAKMNRCKIRRNPWTVEIS